MWETPFFLGLGVVGGLVGALFNAVNFRINRWRRDRLTGRPLLRMIEAVAVAALSASVAFWAPYFLDSCHVIPAVVRVPAHWTALAIGLTRASRTKH